MRNMALVALRQLKFSGQAVARVLGLTENYVATLYSAAKRDGSAALAGQQRRGRPDTVSAQDWDLARQWRAAGLSDAEIGRRLGVAHTTISRRLGPRAQRARRAPVHRLRRRSRGRRSDADAAVRARGPGPPRDRNRMTRSGTR